MSTIPTYPQPVAPLDGTELLAAWQNGQQVALLGGLLRSTIADPINARIDALGQSSGDQAATLNAAIAATNKQIGQLSTSLNAALDRIAALEAAGLNTLHIGSAS